MRFKVTDKLVDGQWEVYCLDDPEIRIKYPNTPILRAMAHDYCDFLNDKYCDKEINKEWPGINRYERIKYHLEQLQLLRSDKKLHWNEHGNMVE